MWIDFAVKEKFETVFSVSKSKDAQILEYPNKFMESTGDKTKTLFIWLFTLIGLVLVIIGSVGLFNLGLKIYVFPKADKDYCVQPMPMMAPESKKVEMPQQPDYLKQCLENQLARRQKDAAQNLSFLIVGLPIFFYFLRKTKTN